MKKHYKSKKMVLANLSISSERMIRTRLSQQSKSNPEKIKRILADKEKRIKEWRLW